MTRALKHSSGSLILRYRRRALSFSKSRGKQKSSHMRAKVERGGGLAARQLNSSSGILRIKMWKGSRVFEGGGQSKQRKPDSK